ncbi:MAG: hypothetical protein M1832_004245 [Thelocarpon impressellum]|nr:MAG: hypothetical protein M1832_004245 [Thelocarpon impressellum]
MEDGSPVATKNEGVRGHEGEESGSANAQGHRRSLSGGLLAKLSFLRSSHDDRPEEANEPNDRLAAEAPRREKGAMQQTLKSRKRKGSLRKTALLGTGRNRLDGRERRGTTLQPLQAGMNGGSQDDETSPTSPESVHGYRTFQFPVDGQSPGTLLSSLDTTPGAEHGSLLESPSTSPVLVETSTTDEEDVLTLPRAPLTAQALKKPPADADSYFPAQPSGLSRHRRSTSPLALDVHAAAAADEWDYSVTEWWGWVVLVVTWVVFVVGMGSCLEVWSWAWDVGETPYAPPELEDDPTLPIVGYYPALIILTAVMAWVWVVVAWVGMKYFKHAKISGEEL